MRAVDGETNSFVSKSRIGSLVGCLEGLGAGITKCSMHVNVGKHSDSPFFLSQQEHLLF